MWKAFSKNFMMSPKQYIGNIVYSVVLAGVMLYNNGFILELKCLGGVLYIYPLLTAVFLVITSLHKVFRMGVGNFRKAGLLKRMLPVVYVGVLIIGITLIKQTYVTAVFASYLMGSVMNYFYRMFVIW